MTTREALIRDLRTEADCQRYGGPVRIGCALALLLEAAAEELCCAGISMVATPTADLGATTGGVQP